MFWFFFSSRRRHTRWPRDWSSDVCSSDLDSLDLVAADATRGRVSGGGARSDDWLRIVASVLELPLERTATDEGAAFGAALLGGVAAAAWPNVEAATAATVVPAGRTDPVDAWVEPYRELRAARPGPEPPQARRAWGVGGVAARQRSRPLGDIGGRARSHRGAFQVRARADRPRRRYGHHQPVRPSRLQRRCFHLE